MKAYLEMLDHIMTTGINRPDRTGTGTRGVFGYQFRHNLQAGFPLLTTKKVNIDAIIYELLWFLKGSTNIKYLNDNGVHIWDANADENGELGPVYPKQWRSWEYWNYSGDPYDSPKEFSIEHIDQIAKVIRTLKEDPFSRRHIVSAWNVVDLPRMKLEPCHVLFQFYVTPANGREMPSLSCHMYQRSADTFLGVPFNIASYALLTMMIAQVCGMYPGELIISFGDLHVYKDHFGQVKEQLSRTPRVLPFMLIDNKVKDIDGFTRESFKLGGYDPYPAIKAKMSV
jgi:thymidylate synthase